MRKLSNFRLLFILYIIFRVIAEIFFGSGIYEESLREIPVPEFVKSPVVFIVTTLLSNAFLLLIGLLFFYYLLKKRNWARITLIIIGILNLIDSAVGLMFDSKITALISRIFGTPQIGQAIFLEHVKDVLALLFWGYAVYLLIVDEETREIFLTKEE